MKDDGHDNRRGSLRVSLYADSVPRLLTYVPLLHAIKAAGHKCDLLISPEIKPTASEVPTWEDCAPTRVHASEIVGLKEVDVFISSEAFAADPPIGAASVGIHHGLPDRPGLTRNYANIVRKRPKIVKNFDYYVIVSQQCRRNWRADQYERVANGLYPEALLASRADYFHIVPGGYTKVGFLAEALNQSITEELDTIVYAPTNMGVSHAEVSENGEEIIASLLEQFPTYNVVFRPYPGNKSLESIESRFTDSPRFDVDRTVTGLTYLRRTAAVVTDNSSFAVTFALASLRPVLFCNMTGGARIDRLERLEESGGMYEEAVGYRVTAKDDLVYGLDLALTHRDHWREKILKARDRILYNGTDAATYIASKIDKFARQESDSDFLRVSRKPWEEVFPDEDVGDYINRLRLLWSEASKNQIEALDEIRATVGAGQ